MLGKCESPDQFVPSVLFGEQRLGSALPVRAHSMFWLIDARLSRGRFDDYALLPVPRNQIGEMSFAQTIHKPRGGLTACRVKSQVQRSFRVKAETTVHVGQLLARNAEAWSMALTSVIPSRQARPGRKYLSEFDRQAGQPHARA